MSGGSAAPSSTTATPWRSATARTRAGASVSRSGRPCRTTEARETGLPAALANGVSDLGVDIDLALLNQGMDGRGEIQEVLAVPRRARMRRIAHAQDGGALRGDELAKIVQHLCAHRGVANHAAAHQLAAGLELGLHQHDRPP